jgi:hypothetical protein
VHRKRQTLRRPGVRRVFFVEVHEINDANGTHVYRRELGVEVVRRLVRLDNRLEGRGHLLARKRRPIDALEEGVFLELLCIALRAETMLRVAVE